MCLMSERTPSTEWPLIQIQQGGKMQRSYHNIQAHTSPFSDMLKYQCVLASMKSCLQAYVCTVVGRQASLAPSQSCLIQQLYCAHGINILIDTYMKIIFMDYRDTTACPKPQSSWIEEHPGVGLGLIHVCQGFGSGLGQHCGGSSGRSRGGSRGSWNPPPP